MFFYARLEAVVSENTQVHRCHRSYCVSPTNHPYSNLHPVQPRLCSMYWQKSLIYMKIKKNQYQNNETKTKHPQNPPRIWIEVKQTYTLQKYHESRWWRGYMFFFLLVFVFVLVIIKNCFRALNLINVCNTQQGLFITRIICYKVAASQSLPEYLISH